MGRQAQYDNRAAENRTEMAKEDEKPINVADPFARRLIVQYLKRRKADVDRLQQALQGGDLELIRIAGHNMSGSGSAYGFDQISEVGSALELAANADDTSGIEGLIDQLDRILASIRLT